MNQWNDENFLAVVEALAESECMICSEEELSEAFDDYLDEMGNPDRHTPTDIRCMFADWSDGMGQDGEIHREQCNNYCYVGKFNS